MHQQLACPACDKRLAIPEEAAGRKLRCPKCGNVAKCPEQDAAPGSSPPPEKRKTRPRRARKRRPAPPREPEYQAEEYFDEYDPPVSPAPGSRRSRTARKRGRRSLLQAAKRSPFFRMSLVLGVCSLVGVVIVGVVFLSALKDLGGTAAWDGIWTGHLPLDEPSESPPEQLESLPVQPESPARPWAPRAEQQESPAAAPLVNAQDTRRNKQKFQAALQTAIEFSPASKTVGLTSDLHSIPSTLSNPAEKELFAILKSIEAVQIDLSTFYGYSRFYKSRLWQNIDLFGGAMKEWERRKRGKWKDAEEAEKFEYLSETFACMKRGREIGRSGGLVTAVASPDAKFNAYFEEITQECDTHRVARKYNLKSISSGGVTYYPAAELKVTLETQNRELIASARALIQKIP